MWHFNGIKSGCRKVHAVLFVLRLSQTCINTGCELACTRQSDNFQICVSPGFIFLGGREASEKTQRPRDAAHLQSNGGFGESAIRKDKIRSNFIDLRKEI